MKIWREGFQKRWPWKTGGPLVRFFFLHEKWREEISGKKSGPNRGSVGFLSGWSFIRGVHCTACYGLLDLQGCKSRRLKNLKAGITKGRPSPGGAQGQCPIEWSRWLWARRKKHTDKREREGENKDTFLLILSMVVFFLNSLWGFWGKVHGFPICVFLFFFKVEISLFTYSTL